MKAWSAEKATAAENFFPNYWKLQSLIYQPVTAVPNPIAKKACGRFVVVASSKQTASEGVRRTSRNTWQR